jgi:hypothetical protein
MRLLDDADSKDIAVGLFELMMGMRPDEWEALGPDESINEHA